EAEGVESVAAAEAQGGMGGGIRFPDVAGSVKEGEAAGQVAQDLLREAHGIEGRAGGRGLDLRHKKLSALYPSQARQSHGPQRQAAAPPAARNTPNGSAACAR